jgi:hypothetical protein
MPKAGGWLAADGSDFTCDYTQATGQVRLLANETDQAFAMFADAEIAGYLALNCADVRLAAAQVLDTKAIWFNQTQGRTQVGGISGDKVDGVSIALQMKASADELRRQVYEDGGAFDIIEQVPNQFAFSERLQNQWLRGL